ncbi:MAG: hypothetical protein H7Y09_12505 [Chitinophagaceae bacterium]|nr:hypothetical protein [Anaerolineae bacterium]
MAVLLNPNARVIDSDADVIIGRESAAAKAEAAQSAAIIEEYAEKPGISGINPFVLGITILVGIMMWAVILYVGYAALNLIF